MSGVPGWTRWSTDSTGNPLMQLGTGEKVRLRSSLGNEMDFNPDQGSVQVFRPTQGATSGGSTDHTSLFTNAFASATTTVAGGGFADIVVDDGTWNVNTILGPTGTNVPNGNFRMRALNYGKATLLLKVQTGFAQANRHGHINLEGPNFPFTNVIFQGLIFDGNKTNQDSSWLTGGNKKQMAIFRLWNNASNSVNVQNILFEDCIIQNSIAAGIECEAVDFVRVNRCQFINNGWLSGSSPNVVGNADGIYLTGAGFQCWDSYFFDNKDTNISYEGSSSSLKYHSSILRNKINSPTDGSQVGIACATGSSYPAIATNPANFCTVEDNDITLKQIISTHTTGAYGMHLEDYTATNTMASIPHDIYIRKNRISTTDLGGIVTKGDNVWIEGNTISNDGQQCVNIVGVPGGTGTFYVRQNHFISGTGVAILVAATVTVGTLYIDGNRYEPAITSQLTKSGTVTTLLNTDGVQLTSNGSTAGTAVSSQSYTSNLYKRFTVYLTAWQDAGLALTYPTAFTKTPFTVTDVSAGATVTTTTLTLPNTVGAAKTGWVIVEGY